MLAMQQGRFSSLGWVHHHCLEEVALAGLPLCCLLVCEPGAEARVALVRQAHPLLLLELQDAWPQPVVPHGEFLRGGQVVGAELFPI